MTDAKLVHESDMELHGNSYEIRVFCSESGHHFARTYFSEDDIIINDGPTLHEALQKHKSLLPLAVSSRLLLQRRSGWPTRSRTNRS